MRRELEIIFRIWNLEEEWEKIADPQWMWYGNMTFHNPNDNELFRMVEIQDEINTLNKQLKQNIGLWDYVKFKIAPLRYVKKINIKLESKL